jgi:hypothetical protein
MTSLPRFSPHLGGRAPAQSRGPVREATPAGPRDAGAVVHQAGWFALTALVLVALLGPLQARIWYGAAGPAWIDRLAQSGAALLGLHPLPDAPAAEARQPAPAYFAAGRVTLLVYAALGLAVWRGLLGRRGGLRRVVLGLLVVATVGDALAYRVSATAGPHVRALGFWRVELPALCALVALVTGTGLRRALRSQAGICAGTRPRIRGQGVALALALPFALGATALIRYLPHGLLTGLALASAVAAFLSPRSGARPRLNS